MDRNRQEAGKKAAATAKRRYGADVHEVAGRAGAAARNAKRKPKVAVATAAEKPKRKRISFDITDLRADQVAAMRVMHHQMKLGVPGLWKWEEERPQPNPPKPWYKRIFQ